LEDAKLASPADVSLSELRDRNPTWTVGMLCFLREQGGYSDEGIARRLHFDSVEDMRAQLRRWVRSDWLVGGESQINLTKDKGRKESTPRWRSLGSAKELPPAGNATALFKERFEALLESVELLRHMDIGLYAWRARSRCPGNPSIQVVQVLGYAGFDFLFTDLEHSPIDPATAHAMVVATAGTPAVPLVRVAWNVPRLAKPALDMGGARYLLPDGP
jgi:hypothetical protein